MRSEPDGQSKVVWGVVTRGRETVWAKVGIAWEGPSGALLVRLDAFPISGRLCIRSRELAPDVSEEGVVISEGAPCPYVPAAEESAP